MQHAIDTLPVSVLRDVLHEIGELVSQFGPIEKLTINHLGIDSREVGPNGLFAALRGTKTDGHRFIDKAVQNGATAIVCETVPEALRSASGTAFIGVRNARRALAHIAARSYGNPSDELTVTGITGTNAKTTTAWLVAHVLEGSGRKTGLLSTIHYRIGQQILGSGLTTPDSLTLQQTLRRMKTAGCSDVVMEVSSHAIDQHRADAISFDAAVFTNLTRDHLDYHGSFENYLLTKKKLFDGLSQRALSIYNAQDAAGSRLVSDTKSKKRSFGAGRSADYHLQILENSLDGLQLKINERLLHSRFVGDFNAQNLTAAFATGCELGVDPDQVIDLLQSAPAVPGRFERIDCRENVRVFVDYAHTPDALQNVLKTIRSSKGDASNTWCVFGCGGDRDAGKRPLMGAIAGALADRVIVTSDNPRSENPLAIIEDIKAGIPPEADTQIIPDRKEAIHLACTRAERGDVVLIAGKGHETYQLIGKDRRPFDDRHEVRLACEKHKTGSEPNDRIPSVE